MAVGARTEFDSNERASAVSLLSLVILAALFLLLAPLFSLGFAHHPLNDQRCAQVLLISLAQVTLLYLLLRGQYGPLLPQRAWYCLLGFIALGALASLLIAEHKLESFGEVGLWSGLGSMSAVTALVVRRCGNDVARWIGLAVLCLAGTYVLGVAARVLGTLEIGHDIDVHVFVLSGYTNPRFPSTTLTLYSALILFASKGTFRSLLLPLTVASCLWAIQLGLGTRAAWVATGLALFSVTVLVGIRRTVRIHLFTLASMSLGALIFFGLVAAGGLWNSDLGFLGRIHELTDPNLREVLWAKSIQYAASSPLLGIGPMHFAANEQNLFAHPHNWLLQVAAEWGLPAAGLLCAAGYFLWRESKHKRVGSYDSPRPFEVALFATLVAVFYGLLDGNYVMPISQTAVALTAGVFLGTVSERRSFTRASAGSLSLLAVIALSLPSLAALAVRTYPCQQSIVEQVSRLHGFENFAPRFWLSGWIPACP